MPLILNGATSGSTTIQATDATTQTITLPANSGTVLTSLSTQSQLPANIAGNGPAFYAYLSANQTGVASSTFTKIAFNTVASPGFDTNSNFNTSTNRFTPTVAGYYLVIAAFQSASGSPTQMVCGIYKNGSAYMYGNNVVATAPQALNVTALVYCNGSTDYLEAWGYQTAAGSFLALSTATYFQGYLARSA